MQNGFQVPKGHVTRTVKEAEKNCIDLGKPVVFIVWTKLKYYMAAENFAVI